MPRFSGFGVQRPGLFRPEPSINLGNLSRVDPEAAELGFWMNHPQYGADFDGDPYNLTASEFMATQAAYAPFYPAQVARLAAAFGHTQAPRREEQISSTGATIAAYDPASFQHVERVLKQLATNPAMAPIVAGASVLVSPPGQGLEGIPGLDPELHEAEGVAFPAQFAPFPVALDNPKSEGVLITHASLHQWDMGLVHELLHLLQYKLTPQQSQKIDDVYQSIVGPVAQTDPSLDPGHVFVYAAQYYLAGYPEAVKEAAPEVYPLCVEFIGEPPPPSRPFDAGIAKDAVADLMARYRA